MKEHRVTAVEETWHIAQELAETLGAGNVVLLIGELGAGKTTFVQGMARALHIMQPVKSPTFTMLWEYDVPGRTIRLYHFDLYRLDEGSSTENIGLDEVLARSDGIIVVEWADKMLHPPRGVTVHIGCNSDDSRTITVADDRQTTDDTL